MLSLTEPYYLFEDAGLSHLARNDTKVIVQTVRPDHWSHTARGAMRFKRFKTYVLEYMDLDRRLDDIDLVLYMDIDILVGDSLMDFVHGFVQSPYCRNSNNTNNGTITTVPAATKQNESLRRSTKTSGRICHRAGSDDDSRLYHFTDNDNSIFPFHGGFCIMERPKSQYCLELWRKEIDEAGGTSDQYALKRLLWHFAEHNVTGCELIAMNRGETFVFPITRSLIAMKHKKEFPTFVHITATTRAKSIDAGRIF